MIRRALLSIVAFVLVSGGAASSLDEEPGCRDDLRSVRARPVLVMPLGDSITHGYETPGGYRIRLWQRLAVESGFQFRFVGSQRNGPRALGSKAHEGHPGWTIPQIEANVDRWLDTYKPDWILLHIGTNDLWDELDVDVVLQRLDRLLDRIFERRPNALVVVAQIVHAELDEEYVARVAEYARRTAEVVARQQAKGHTNLLTADMHSAGIQLADGVHPTRRGYDAMAEVWLRAISPGLAGSGLGLAGRGQIFVTNQYCCRNAPTPAASASRNALQSEICSST